MDSSLLDKDEERRQRRLQRADERKGEKVKVWQKKKVDPRDPDGKIKITFDPDVDLDSEVYKQFEAKLASNNIAIVKKYSSRFARGIVVKGDAAKIFSLKQTDDHIVDIISEVPRIVVHNSGLRGWVAPEEQFSPCDVDIAKAQLAVLDTLGMNLPEDRENKGQGAILIAWDEPFTPNDKFAEFNDRPGGKPVLFGLGAVPGIHGGYVMSTCCGNTFGLASGAELGLVGFAEVLETSLSVIDSIIQFEKQKPQNEQKAVVVNFSFGMVYSSYKHQQAQIKSDVAKYNDIMKKMKEEYPRLVFINASGNDGDNTCDKTFGDSSNACTECYSWPTYAHGGPYGIGDEPFVRIGSVHGTTPEIPSHRELAHYTNRGPCTVAYAHGNVCAFNVEQNAFTTIMGTSFAAPLFASIVALVMTKYPTMSGDDAIRKIVNAGDMLPGGETFARVEPSLLSLGPEAPSAGGTGATSLGEAATQVEEGSKALSRPPMTSSEKTTVGSLAALGALIAAGAWYRTKRKEFLGVYIVLVVLVALLHHFEVIDLAVIF